MTKLVYIAAPYTTNDPVEKELNIQAAKYAGYKIAKLGFYPVMPTLNTAGFDGVGGEDFWYQSTLELMRRCDAVYVVDGSFDSKGVQAEIDEAIRLKMLVFTEIKLIKDLKW